jgi:hypothetical protein
VLIAAWVTYSKSDFGLYANPWEDITHFTSYLLFCLAVSMMLYKWVLLNSKLFYRANFHRYEEFKLQK